MLGTSISRWSPSAWQWLHTEDHLTPELLHLLVPILPCNICSVHMRAYLSTNTLERHSDIRLYLFRMHNNIRHNQDKPIMFTNVQSLRSTYESVNTMKAFQQFTYAAACVCELDPTKWTDFETFFTVACEIMNLEIPVYDHHSPGHVQNWLHFVYTHFQDKDMTYEEVVKDFLPTDFYKRFKAPSSHASSCSRITSLGVFGIICIVLIVLCIVLRFDLMMKR
jgi:hypothetical protein